jgi:competence protein ComEA
MSMIKKILAGMLALFAAAAFAAVDANKATQAELETIKGIGPSISTKILDERKKGAFKDWPDMVERVKGVGEGNAAKFSAEGLTVNGASFAGAPAKAAAPAAKKDDKPAAKADDKKSAAPAAAPAASASKADKAKKEAKPAATAAPASTAKK